MNTGMRHTFGSSKSFIINISLNKIGGTYAKISEDYININETKIVEVYVNGLLNNTINDSSKNDVYAVNLDEQTTYSIYIKIDGFVSNTINVTTTLIDKNALFSNGIFNFKFDETTGNPVDEINGINGTINGTVNRDGVYYKFSDYDNNVEIANNSIFEIGTNDFVLKTEFIFDVYPSKNTRLFCKLTRPFSGNDSYEWEFTLNYIYGMTFVCYKNGNVYFNVPLSFRKIPKVGQKVIIGISKLGYTLRFFQDDSVLYKTDISDFNLPLQPPNIIIGDYNTLGTNDIFDGKIKESWMIIGNGWGRGEISDIYNQGLGTTL